MTSDHPLLEDDSTGAVISDDGRYRYRLWRTWNADLPTAAFVLLNPSTADDTEDDATVRRCIGYARRWGYGRLELVNLFAYRATDPAELEAQADPVGPSNDDHIRAVCRDGPLVVAGWGNGGELLGRGREVCELLRDELAQGPYAIGTTTDGHPWHPLRKPADLTPEPFSY